MFSFNVGDTVKLTSKGRSTFRSSLHNEKFIIEELPSRTNYYIRARTLGTSSAYSFIEDELVLVKVANKNDAINAKIKQLEIKFAQRHLNGKDKSEKE